jgi:hypothetical protein
LGYHLSLHVWYQDLKGTFGIHQPPMSLEWMPSKALNLASSIQEVMAIVFIDFLEVYISPILKMFPPASLVSSP